MGRHPLRAIAMLASLAVAPPCLAGDNLHLAPDLSFTDDSSSAFPIRGDRLEEAEYDKDRPSVIFFGATHCWNTNREAERLVSLYPKFRDRVSFIVVDVQNPSEAQQPLMKKHFSGYIPTVVVLDAAGQVVYDRSGETAAARGDTTYLERLLSKAGAGGDAP